MIKKISGMLKSDRKLFSYGTYVENSKYIQDTEREGEGVNKVALATPN